jgi:hypothetical protein
MSPDQLREALAYFSQKPIPPNKRQDIIPFEHYWQCWYERLPARLFKASKRAKITKAFREAIAHFENEV